MNFPFLSKKKYKYTDSYSKEYAAWYSMLDRCYNKDCQAWDNYGGRGITVCDRWLGNEGFNNFFEDMGLAPSINHSLDRIDNSLGYFPNNCRWATDKEQARNRRSNKKILLNGEEKSLAEWCEIYNISYFLVKDRLKDNWDITVALTMPRKRNNLNIGEKFNSWTVLNKIEGVGKYNCQCDCGNLSIIKGYDLLNNKSTKCKSCAMSGNTYAAK